MNCKPNVSPNKPLNYQNFMIAKHQFCQVLLHNLTFTPTSKDRGRQGKLSCRSEHYGFETIIEWSEKAFKQEALPCKGSQTNLCFKSYILLTGGLIEVYIDSLELEVAVTGIRACWVNTVLVRDHFPELQKTEKNEGILVISYWPISFVSSLKPHILLQCATHL